MWRLSAYCCLAFAALLGVASASKLEPAGAFADASASAAMKDSLETAGHRVVMSDGSLLCEIWLRKSLPGTPGTKAEGANYPELTESEFIGVISFPKGGKDFRGQAIRPGAYSLRYELMPNDGNHLGAAPARGFLLLVPMTADQDPSAAYQYDPLVGLSRQASGTNHPAVLMLLAPEGELPRAYTSGDGYEVFAAKLKIAGGKELPLAVVVKGEAEQ